jgi:hypothetical protein
MKRTLVTVFVALAAFLVLPATPALAQATRTWVSGVGDDANPCSRTAPCRTYAGAISKTAAGGEINAIDPGGFGGVTITKAITIRADGVTGGVLVAGTNGIIINAGVNDKVVLEGLDIEGLGTGLAGIRIISARDVVVRNTTIRNFRGGAAAGVQVDGAVQVSVVISDSTILNNGIGVLVSSAGGNGAARVYDSVIVGNTTAGVRVSGAGNRAEISGSRIIRSPKGLEILSGGTIFSYGDNVLTVGDAPTVIPKG